MRSGRRYGLVLFFFLMFVGSTGVTIMQINDFRTSEAARNGAEKLAELPTLKTQRLIAMEPVGISKEKEPFYTDAVAEAMNEMNLEALQRENEDIVGWIMIPDTEISYPLLQGEDNTYYLEHTWEHTKSRGGSIFLEQMCSRDLTDYNTIIYGHRMKNRSMFGSLAFYQEKEYLENQ